MGQPRRWPL